MWSLWTLYSYFGILNCIAHNYQTTAVTAVHLNAGNWEPGDWVKVTHSISCIICDPAGGAVSEWKWTAAPSQNASLKKKTLFWPSFQVLTDLCLFLKQHIPHVLLIISACWNIYETSMHRSKLGLCVICCIFHCEFKLIAYCVCIAIASYSPWKLAFSLFSSLIHQIISLRIITYYLCIISYYLQDFF